MWVGEWWGRVGGWLSETKRRAEQWMREMHANNKPHSPVGMWAWSRCDRNIRQHYYRISFALAHHQQQPIPRTCTHFMQATTIYNHNGTKDRDRKWRERKNEREWLSNWYSNTQHPESYLVSVLCSVTNTACEPNTLIYIFYICRSLSVFRCFVRVCASHYCIILCLL